MENKIVKQIIEIDKQIDEIALKITPYYDYSEEQKLNYYDNKILEYYEKILDLIIELSKEENEKNIKIIDKKYFKIENTASTMIESYIAMLLFYRDMENRIIEKEIEIINKIQENIKVDIESEITNRVELADCYFKLGDEEKARNLMLKLINEYPDEDEAYQCMQNWYIDDKTNIKKLAEIIDLAEKNKHILFTDFGYDRLIEFYDNIGDIDNKKKYEQLYNEWKKNREKLDF